jgi:hypothetical protein
MTKHPNTQARMKPETPKPKTRETRFFGISDLGFPSGLGISSFVIYGAVPGLVACPKTSLTKRHSGLSLILSVPVPLHV